jgi:hypothetical protein
MIEGKIHTPVVSNMLPEQYSQRVAVTKKFVHRFIGCAIVFFLFVLAIGVWEANIKSYVSSLMADTEALWSRRLANFDIRINSFDSRLTKLERENHELSSTIRSLRRSRSRGYRRSAELTDESTAENTTVNAHQTKPVRTASLAENQPIQAPHVPSVPEVKAPAQKDAARNEPPVNSVVALLRAKGQSAFVAEYGNVTLAYNGPEVVIAMAASKKPIADENFSGAIIEKYVIGDKVVYKIWKSVFE